MTTTKSYSNKGQFWAFYKNSLKQGRAFMIISSLVSLLLIPLPFFTIVNNRYFHVNKLMSDFFKNGVITEIGFNIALTFLMGVLTIVVATYYSSYLFFKKNTDFYHSLPITRPNILKANLLAGMTNIGVPFVLVFVTTMLIQVAMFSEWISTTYFICSAIDLASTLLYIGVVFLFTSFIAVNAGTVFDSLALTSIIGLIPFACYIIFNSLWDKYIYGYGGYNNLRYLGYTSPFSYVFQRFILQDRGFWEGNMEYYKSAGIAFIYGLVLIVVFYILAVVFYNKRKSEQAEDSLEKSWAKIISKTFVAFLGATIFFTIFEEFGMFGRLIFTIIGAIVAGILAELVLSRNIKTLLPNLKWAGVAIGIFALMLGSVYFDVFGYSGKIPNIEKVAEIRVDYKGRYESLVEVDYDFYNNIGVLTDRESIAIASNSHKIAVENQPPKYGNYYSSDDNFEYYRYDITYIMQDGTTFSRRFDWINIMALQELAKLEDQEDFKKTNNPIFLYDTKPELSSEMLISRIELRDAYNNSYETLNLKKIEITGLLEALRTDMLAVKDLEEIKNDGINALFILNIVYQNDSKSIMSEEIFYTENYYDNNRESWNEIIVTDKYTNTIKFLKSIGRLENYEKEKNFDTVYLSTYFDYYDNVECVVARGRREASSEISRSVVITEKGDINIIDNASRNILYKEKGDKEENRVMAAIFYEDGESVGTKLVAYKDLPKNVQEKVDSMGY